MKTNISVGISFPQDILKKIAIKLPWEYYNKGYTPKYIQTGEEEKKSN